MRTVLTILAGLVFTSAAMAWAEQDETAGLNTWLDERYEEELQQSPYKLAQYGRKEKYDQMDDYSLAADIRWLDWIAASRASMSATFDYDKLTEQGKTSYDFWSFRAESEESERNFLEHNYIFTQFNGTHTFPVVFLANYHAVDNEADMLAYIGRIGALSRAMEQLLERTQLAAEKGIRPPRFSYQGVIAQSGKVISGYPFEQGEQEASIWIDASSKINNLLEQQDISAERAEQLQAMVRDALLQKLLPVYQRLIAWHEQDIVNTSGQAQGAHALPNGDAYYRRQLRYYTHSDMTAEEVHQLGLDEVARIKGEMDKIRQNVGFKGTLQDFFAHVRDDERFYYPNNDEGREAYLREVERLMDEMSLRLPEYFGLLPKAALSVKRVEPYREQDGAAQFYQVGTADGSRPGVYYMHLSDMGAYNLTDLETTAYHEGNPGHHMQLSIAKELTGIPRFRTDVGYSAYYEGWALYAEYLAKEMGAFDDPYNDFGRLVAEIWRALRLVIDTGLHAKGWTEEQAVQYMLENSAIPEVSVRAEVQRYLVMPGQATSYKAGMLKIQALRAHAEKRLGDKFDIREFHDVVLGGGAVPLPILERAVDTWITSQLQ